MSDTTMLVVNIGLGCPPFMSDNTRASFQDACSRWGCDYVEINDKGNFRYHPPILKLKAFDLCPHSRIFVVDADAIIRSDAPNPFENMDQNYLWAVKNQQLHHPSFYQHANVILAKQQIEEILKHKPIKYNFDVDEVSRDFFNSGVVMLNRELHEPILALAYWLLLRVPGINWWDQIPLNIAAYTLLGGYHELGIEWNYMFPTNRVKMNAYIYHFAGDNCRYEILKTLDWKA